MRALLILITFLFSYTAFSQDTVLTEYVSRNPYYKNVIIESGYRTTYYLSEFDRGKKLPLIIYIQGSGYNSLFSKQGESIVPTSGHINLPYLSQGKAKVLIIEKPGVEFLDNRSSNDRNEEFDKQFSLENWSRRIEKVISRVLLSEKIDSTKIMVVGHSEGGIVAARVANLMKGRISNVCIMAGEGPSQLYSLYSLAKSGEFFNENGKNEGERINYVLEKWNEIKRDSVSTTKFFWGFSYLRWHSFLKTSVIDELDEFKGSVLILQGDKDINVNPESSRVLFTSLLSKGVDCELKIITGADHSFNINNDNVSNGWKVALEQSIKWFIH